MKRAVRQRDRSAACSCKAHGSIGASKLALYLPETYNVLMHVLTDVPVTVVQEWPLRTKDASGRYRKGCFAHGDLALFIDTLCIIVEVHGSSEHLFCGTTRARDCAKKAAIADWQRKSCSLELLVIWAPHLWPEDDGGPVDEVAWPAKIYDSLRRVLQKHDML
jgi:hypothetical protein